MDLKIGYYLGKDYKGFFIWNEKELIRLNSKTFKEALKESNIYDKNN